MVIQITPSAGFCQGCNGLDKRETRYLKDTGFLSFAIRNIQTALLSGFQLDLRFVT
jgi:hypothetical protein